ncbi:hypothetical protein ACQEVC_42080 [Plantactinospora sp. CA-294935]
MARWVSPAGCRVLAVLAAGVIAGGVPGEQVQVLQHSFIAGFARLLAAR